MEQRTGSKLGEEYVKAVYCYSVYLTYKQSTSCKMLVWMNHKLESRLLGEISIISSMQVDTTLMAKSKQLKNLLMKVKEESEKAGLKLNIQMGKKMETVAYFIFLSSKITVDGDYIHEIKDACFLEGMLWQN